MCTTSNPIPTLALPLKGRGQSDATRKCVQLSRKPSESFRWPTSMFPTINCFPLSHLSPASGREGVMPSALSSSKGIGIYISMTGNLTRSREAAKNGARRGGFQTRPGSTIHAETGSRLPLLRAGRTDHSVGAAICRPPMLPSSFFEPSRLRVREALLDCFASLAMTPEKAAFFPSFPRKRESRKAASRRWETRLLPMQRSGSLRFGWLDSRFRGNDEVVLRAFAPSREPVCHLCGFLPRKGRGG